MAGWQAGRQAGRQVGSRKAAAHQTVHSPTEFEMCSHKNNVDTTQQNMRILFTFEGRDGFVMAIRICKY